MEDTQRICRKSQHVSLYIYHGDTISIDENNFEPRRWQISPPEKVCQGALKHLIHIGEVTDSVVAYYITQKRFRVFKHASGEYTVFLHAERIGMLPLPIASIYAAPIAEWISRQKTHPQIRIPDTFQTIVSDNPYYVAMPRGGAPKPIHRLLHGPPKVTKKRKTLPTIPQGLRGLDKKEQRIADSIRLRPPLPIVSSPEATAHHIASLVAQNTVRAYIHVDILKITWQAKVDTYAGFHESVVNSGVGGTVEHIAFFWALWRKLRYKVRCVEAALTRSEYYMSILRKRTREFDELYATHKESPEVLRPLETQILSLCANIRHEKEMYEIFLGESDVIDEMCAHLRGIQGARTNEWNPTLGPEMQRRFPPTTTTRWPPIEPVVAQYIPIDPITSLIAEYAETLHANRDYLVTTARTATDTFLRIEQEYYRAVTAPFVPNVAGARAAVAMTVMVLRAATVSVDHTWKLAAATTQEEMHIRTNRRAMCAENVYILIQEYAQDSMQFASHSETLPPGSAQLEEAAHAAHYFMLQAFYQTYKLHKDHVQDYRGQFM